MAQEKQMLKLKAETQAEKKVLDYLNENASPVLAEKINAGKKTLSGAMDYAKSEARKLAKGSGCVCVEDDTVFGWVIHFFEEDSVKEPKRSPKRTVRTPGKAKPAKKAKSKPAQDPQTAFNLFSDAAQEDVK